MIDRDRWADAVKQGWRFQENCLPDDTESNVLRIAALVQEYGAERVDVGFAFGPTSPGVASDLGGFAIYIRDGAEIIGELFEDLLNYEHGHALVIIDV